jgi:hypothetical protein
VNMAKQMEQSEILFQRYCEHHGYNFNRIDESSESGIRSPDFCVVVKGQKIIAEVKEITANEEEIKLWRETRSGKIVVHRREPGKRARKHVEDAVGQLRPYAEKNIPTVVVLYDNIYIDGLRPHPFIDLFGPLGPYDIDVALFGLQTANLRIHPDGSTESLGDGRSRWRKVHDRECISAVSVLYEYPDNEGLFMFTYHNFFARTSLPVSVFAETVDRHFIKPKHPDLCPGNWTVQPTLSTDAASL